MVWYRLGVMVSRVFLMCLNASWHEFPSVHKVPLWPCDSGSFFLHPRLWRSAKTSSLQAANQRLKDLTRSSLVLIWWFYNGLKPNRWGPLVISQSWCSGQTLELNWGSFWAGLGTCFQVAQHTTVFFSVEYNSSIPVRCSQWTICAIAPWASSLVEMHGLVK